MCAARLLSKHGVDVVVLEASDRVGGRTYTKTDPSYGWADLGASYVGPTQNHILRLCKELGCETYKCYYDNDLLHYSKVNILCFLYSAGENVSVILFTIH